MLERSGVAATWWRPSMVRMDCRFMHYSSMHVCVACRAASEWDSLLKEAEGKF